VLRLARKKVARKLKNLSQSDGADSGALVDAVPESTVEGESRKMLQGVWLARAERAWPRAHAAEFLWFQMIHGTCLAREGPSMAGA
jgi:hypothetical protein